MSCAINAATNAYHDSQDEADRFYDDHADDIAERALELARHATDSAHFVETVAKNIAPDLGSLIESVLLVREKATVTHDLVKCIEDAAQEYFDDRAFREVRSEHLYN